MFKSAINVILLLLVALVYIFSACSQSIPAASDQIIAAVERINNEPDSVVFQNTLTINNQGGHLQGIQLLNYRHNVYYVLSGSSDDYSYYSIVKTGKENRVISVNKIMEKPLKHAGGFQIYENLMAVGVEDNDAKNRSRVFIFKIENPEMIPKKPLAVIDRTGLSKRATAGCVAITIIRDKVLVVVGDWDTEHLDFYRIDREKLGRLGEVPVLVSSLDTRKINKTGWINEKWLAYQNINLIQDKAGHLFLAGLTSAEDNENVLDLFKIETDDHTSFGVKKIYSRSFKKNEHSNFRWGAGISGSGNHLKLVSCGEHIEESSLIFIYD